MPLSYFIIDTLKFSPAPVTFYTFRHIMYQDKHLLGVFICGVDVFGRFFLLPQLVQGVTGVAVIIADVDAIKHTLFL